MRSLVRQLQVRKEQVEVEISALQAELARINAAIRALDADDLFDEARENLRHRRRDNGTLKQMAYTVLSEADRPLTARQILQRIKEEFGVAIERTSMSPQLSRLGQQRVLLRDGNLWRINPARREIANGFYLIERHDDLL